MSPALLSSPRSAPPPAAELPHDDAEALIKEARRRQRRRRLVLAAVLLAVAAVGSAIYFGVLRRTASPSPTGQAAPVVSGRRLRLHLAGFGTPLPSAIDSGPCPQGRTLITIRSAVGARLGSVLGCVLTIQKTDVPNYGIARIVQTAIETYTLAGGTIVTKEAQTIRFARDQRHTTAIFRGSILRGTGRYAHAKGVVVGGGPGLDGKADWTINIHLR